MILRYKMANGNQVEFPLGERAITIGRSSEADVMILDKRASRVHCGIELWDGEFFIKDLKSRNGTLVNGQPIDMAKLNPGDQIRVGGCVFSFEAEPGKGNETILREIQDEMSQGKGYATILKEVVEDTGTPKPAAPGQRPSDATGAPPAAPQKKDTPKPAGAPAVRTAPGPAPRGKVQIRLPKKTG